MNILEKIDLLLSEANKVETPISAEEAEKLLETKCAKNFAAGPILFRGNYSINKDYYLFTGKSKRISANTTNYYTALFSNYLSSWSKFPKRDHSLICTTRKTKAEMHGVIYQVVPFDTSGPFGCAGEDDVWDIVYDNAYWRECGVLALPDLNDMLAVFGSDNNFITKMKSTPVQTVIQELIDKDKGAEAMKFAICALWYEGKTVNQAKDMAFNYVYKNEKNLIQSKTLSTNFLDILNKILAPENTSARLVTNFTSLPKDEEVWFDTPAILIKA